MASKNDKWLKKIENSVAKFAKKHATTYSKSQREISASFEIGCFHALVEFYEREFEARPENLKAENEFKYLTTPSGNPANFSYISLKHSSGDFEIRQQVRVKSHLHEDIAFTPDLLVIRSDTEVEGIIERDFAGGKRRFFFVRSQDVVAAHECKSMNPFPELLVSFIGILVVAHKWLTDPTDRSALSEDGIHLAPSLFIGGSPIALQNRMVKALKGCYPINIIMGLHSGNWSLLAGDAQLNLIDYTNRNP